MRRVPRVHEPGQLERDVHQRLSANVRGRGAAMTAIITRIDVTSGTASVVGPAAGSTMGWTSPLGVVGGSCPAPLPIGLAIAVQRQ